MWNCSKVCLKAFLKGDILVLRCKLANVEGRTKCIKKPHLEFQSDQEYLTFVLNMFASQKATWPLSTRYKPSPWCILTLCCTMCCTLCHHQQRQTKALMGICQLIDKFHLWLILYIWFVGWDGSAIFIWSRWWWSISFCPGHVQCSFSPTPQPLSYSRDTDPEILEPNHQHSFLLICSS